MREKEQEPVRETLKGLSDKWEGMEIKRKRHQVRLGKKEREEAPKSDDQRSSM